MASAATPGPPSANMPSPTDATASEPQGVLLYYKYVPLEGEHAKDTACFYTDLCDRLDLRGRIRVARDGINVTVGGSMAALRAHAAAVVAHPLLRGGDIDFKLAPSGGPRNEATRAETKMDRLVVRLCEELVTLGPLARHRADPRVSTAPHLTPEQFHRMLQRAAAVATPTAAEPSQRVMAAAAAAAGVAAEVGLAACTAAAAAGTSGGVATCPEGGGGAADGDGDGVSAADPPGSVVLLDARNVYETRIGHFDGGPAVRLLDPRTRCFSDLPAWMDAHEELLRNRTVLMYCTGGVRCERASAYLREKGPEFSRVFQLSGGIQRYLERFPDGGFFRGKNFLYDDRIAVGPEAVRPASPGAVVGRCLACGCAWDDYGARLRCSRCRLLVLVCDSCNTAHRRRQQQQQQQHRQAKPPPLPHQLEDQTGGGTESPPWRPTSSSGAGKPTGLLDGAVESPPPPMHSLGSAAGSPRRQLTCGSEPPCPLLCELCSAAVAAEGCCEGGSDAGGERGTNPTPRRWTAGRGAAGEGSVCPSVASSPGRGSGPAAARSCALAAERLAGLGRTAGSESGAAAAVAAAVAAASVSAAAAETGAEGPGSVSAAGGSRRLRILCLHGFRQTAKQFQGRTCALRKKLRDLADFVFVDAPHKLPLFVKPRKAAGTAAGDEAGGAGINVNGQEVEELDAQGGDDGAEDEWAVRRTAAAAAKAPFAAKRAWLLPPELYSCAAAPADGLREAPPYVDELQYTRQTAGWQESLAALRAAVRQLGPFDGVFGFSQGASVAAVLCALQQRQQRQRQRHYDASNAAPGPGPGPGPALPTHPTSSAAAAAVPTPTPSPSPSASASRSSAAAATTRPNHDGAAAPPCAPAASCPHPVASGREEHDPAECDFGFRFALLASGFPSPLPEHRELMAAVGPLELPSLHVYGSAGDGGGGGGADRQICPRESEALVAAFSCEGGARRILCHQSGHLIPATRGPATTFRAFLSHFPPAMAP